MIGTRAVKIVLMLDVRCWMLFPTDAQIITWFVGLFNRLCAWCWMFGVWCGMLDVGIILITYVFLDFYHRCTDYHLIWTYNDNLKYTQMLNVVHSVVYIINLSISKLRQSMQLFFSCANPCQARGDGKLLFLVWMLEISRQARSDRLFLAMGNSALPQDNKSRYQTNDY